MLLTGADILVQTLIEQGCDVVFGYPGGQILNVYDALYKNSDKITHVLTAHEQGAAHAADGYARATGKVGVVISTSGPGATNLVTGIATAFLDSVPLVAITGNVPTTQIGSDSFQEIDITGITLPITKHNYFVTDVNELADTVREAFCLASSGRPGPVLIDLPKDVQLAKCQYTSKPHVLATKKCDVDDDLLAQAAECINNSSQPYIYFGGGLVSSQAQDEVLALADKIDAPIGCSMMGLSAISSTHPRFLGMQGMHGHYASSIAMDHADCIISLGCRFNDRVTGNKSKFAPHAKIVHIDIDKAELSKTINAVYGIQADVKSTLQKLLPLVEQKQRPEWQSMIDEFKQKEISYQDKRQGLTPRNAILTLNKYLGENTPVATDVGQHQMWSAQNLCFKHSRRFISSGGLGTMGFGLSAAIGSAIGLKERSVLITGDGSFDMSLHELATAVSYNVPLVVLIMNNGVLGMVRQWQTLFFDKRYSNTVIDRKTNFSALAKAFGGDCERVENVNQLDNALQKAFAYDGVYIIDCAIDKDEFVLPMLPPGGSVADMIVKTGR